jgi:reductive dehalogenase
MSKSIPFYPNILTNDRQLGPYPMEKLKHVDRPTTKVTDDIKKVDERDQGFFKAMDGRLGKLAQKEVMRFCWKYPLGAAQVKMAGHLMPLADGPVAPQKAPIPQDSAILSNHIKALGYYLRADVIGICRLPQWAVYSNSYPHGDPVVLNHKYAIVIVIDQDYKTFSSSRGDDWISISQSYLGYTTSAFIACEMAEYIRKLGYSARAHFDGGDFATYQVVIPPLCLLAGIGEVCRIGIVLNPFIGVRFKASVVTTDLPLESDKPVDFGLQDFCDKCKKCAIECPSHSISADQKVMYNGYEIWKFDPDRCTRYRVTNQNGASCGRCIRVCPWNKPKGWTHDAVRWMVKNTPFLNKAIIKMGDLLGYSKPIFQNKWWFDLEEKDGIIRIPTKIKDIT